RGPPQRGQRSAEAHSGELQQDRVRPRLGGRRPSAPRRRRVRPVTDVPVVADAPPSHSGFERLAGIWSRRGRLGIAVLVGTLAVGLTTAFALPPLYRATATVLVDKEQVPEAFARSAVTGEVETRLHTISQQILSRAKLDELIDRFALYPELRKGPARDAAVDQMRRDIPLEPKAVDQSGGRS